MESVRNLSKLIAERPANAALDYSVVTRVIREVVRAHYPEIQSINSISYETYKRRVGRHHSAFNYGYTIHATKHDGTTITKLLIYSAHTDGSRAYAYDVMHEIITAGFNDDHLRIVRPLEYRADLQALIYEGTPGKKLLTYIEQRVPAHELTHAIKIVAAWIRKFHALPLTPALEQTVRTFDWQDMNTPLADIVTDVSKHDQQQGDKLGHFVTAFKKQQNALLTETREGLVYGDLHPENIIIADTRADNLTMIDFTDVTIGDQLRDIGTFIQQLHFMSRDFYSEADRQIIMETFLAAYFGRAYHEISDSERARVNLYQAWSALRSFVYLFYLGSSQVSAYGLLEDAWRYLYISEQRMKTISIVY